MIGRLIADLGPSEENCRNSEGSFLELKDGSILFAWSRYGVGDGDDGDVCEIWGMVSRDGGETFLLKDTDLFEVMEQLECRLKGKRILDLSAYKDMDVGLPYNLTFVVRKDK